MSRSLLQRNSSLLIEHISRHVLSDPMLADAPAIYFGGFVANET